MPGFLSSNLYYKYLNDLIHSVRGDEFLGGNVSLTAHGSLGPPDDSHPGGSDSSASQVPISSPLTMGRKVYTSFPSVWKFLLLEETKKIKFANLLCVLTQISAVISSVLCRKVVCCFIQATLLPDSSCCLQ